jgi:hypothetical protein
MPDTPPVVTGSLSGTFPFIIKAVPVVIAAAVPFIPAPVEEEGGKARSAVWSAWDMGKERDEVETKTLAWAAVVGRVKDSMISIWMVQSPLDAEESR